jgi:regulator of sirC expression with transglutaminase-like and TPR domain
MKDMTKALIPSTSLIASPVRRKPKRLSPQHLVELATRLFMFKAERWKRRAQFYEQHRECFPRVSASRFVDRCRELEATYRALARILFLMPAQDQLVSARALALRRY